MNKIIKLLDEKLRSMEFREAEDLTAEILSVIERVRASKLKTKGWPDNYFAETAGAFAGEPLERANQGELPYRENW